MLVCSRAIFGVHILARRDTNANGEKRHEHRRHLAPDAEPRRSARGDEAIEDNFVEAAIQRPISARPSRLAEQAALVRERASGLAGCSADERQDREAQGMTRKPTDAAVLTLRLQ